MGNKILVIGIDGGTWHILSRAISGGYMPNLKAITENGASGVLKSVIPAITPAAWGCFQTGCNPGQNGVYDFYKWDNSTKKTVLVSSRNLHKTVWEMATAAGKTVGSLNVPMTFPPKPNCGDIVSGVLTPGLDSAFTSPPELKDALLQHIPDYEILTLDKAEVSPSETDVTSFIEQMNQNLNWRFKAAQYMISQKDYDFFMVHYHATDIVQHGLWGFMDETHPLFDKEKQTEIFRDFYGHLDELIGKTIDLMKSDELTCFMVSDHGFQSHYKQYNMASWLKDKGYIDSEYLGYHSDLEKQAEKKQANSLIKKAKKLGIGKVVRKFMPGSMVENLELKTNLKDKSQTYKFTSNLKCSASCRECFITVIDETNRQGIVDKLIEEIPLITDEHGNKIVEAVYTKEQIYSGKNLADMPDITIVPVANWTFKFDADNLTTITDINLDNTFHMGTHHSDGIFTAVGKNVKPAVKSDNSLLDMAPTISWLLGLEDANSDFDGKLISDIWNEDFIKKMASQVKTNIQLSETQTENTQSFDKEEQETLQKRLNDLGYM